MKRPQMNLGKQFRISSGLDLSQHHTDSCFKRVRKKPCSKHPEPEMTWRCALYIYPPSMSFRSNWLSFTNQRLIYLFIFYLFSSSHQLHSCKYSGSRHHAENSEHPAVCFDFDSITSNRWSTCGTQLAGS